jgi:hypothetical protein
VDAGIRGMDRKQFIDAVGDHGEGPFGYGRLSRWGLQPGFGYHTDPFAPCDPDLTRARVRLQRHHGTDFGAMGDVRIITRILDHRAPRLAGCDLPAVMDLNCCGFTG